MPGHTTGKLKEIKMNLTPLMIIGIVIFVMSIWTIDVSVSCINMGSNCGGMVGLMNFYYEVDKLQSPIMTYHLGIILSIMSFTAVMFLMVHKIETLEKRLK